MNLKNHRRQVLISLWWLLEACILYYYFASLGVGIVIITLLLIFFSCMLLLFKSYKIRVFIYLLLSVYSIFSLLGMCLLYLFSVRVEQYVWRYIAMFIIVVVNIAISFSGFWYNWKRSVPLEWGKAKSRKLARRKLLLTLQRNLILYAYCGNNPITRIDPDNCLYFRKCKRTIV